MRFKRIKGAKLPPLSPDIEVHQDSGEFHKTKLVPDAEFIRAHTPILEVAEKLGLEPEKSGRRVRCPLDRSHLANHLLKRNWILCRKCKRANGKCKYWNPIDLVMEVLQLNAGDAINWIAERWKVPTCKMVLTTNTMGQTKRTYGDYKPRPLPNSATPSVKVITRAAGWTKLSYSARRLALAVIHAVEKENGYAWTGTQEELRGLAGIGSRTSMKRAMDACRGIGLLSTQRVASERSPTRANFTTRLLLKLEWNSNRFREWIDLANCDLVKMSNSGRPRPWQFLDYCQVSEQPRQGTLALGQDDQEACKRYTDKEFVRYLFQVLAERGVVKGDAS